MGKDTKYNFKRFEKKYLLSPEQYANFWAVAGEHLTEDVYFQSLILSVYYDSESFELIRHSLEKPVYKEKLRIRSYGIPTPEGHVFVELKKKFKGVVYKRRVEMTAAEAEAWLAGGEPPFDAQVIREISWFLKTNEVFPKAVISCERESWVDREDPELRFTFDKAIRWRAEDLSVMAGDGGSDLLCPGEVLMEIKIPEAAPLWLAELLSNERIFPTSFSKYGTCYQEDLLKRRFR